MQSTRPQTKNPFDSVLDLMDPAVLGVTTSSVLREMLYQIQLLAQSIVHDEHVPRSAELTLCLRDMASAQFHLVQAFATARPQDPPV